RAERPLQRIGLSATQRPLDEVARFLGGREPVRARSERRQRITGKKPPPSPLATEAPDEAIHDEFSAERPEPPAFRPVTIVDTAEKKRLDLTIEVPVEDMAKIGQLEEIPSGPASQGPARSSIWTAIHPRLLELVRAHRSTLIFVNSRRIAERL